MKILPHYAMTRLIPLLLLIPLVVTGPSVRAGDACATLHEIAPGVHVRQGEHGLAFTEQAIANIGFVVGRECVAVIDSGGSPREGRALRCALREVTELPVCYLIITHAHPDHWLGSSTVLEPDTRIVGHERLPRALSLVGGFYLERLAEFLGGEPDVSLMVEPDLLISLEQPLEIDLGERLLRIQAHPPAHTDTDLTVLDDSTGTLWLSDLLFMEHAPVIDGSSRGWLEVLETLIRQPAARVVPGHGPVTADWPRAAEANLRYLRVVREEAREYLDAGGDLDGASAAVGQSEREHWLLFDEFHARNVLKVYTELEWE